MISNINDIVNSFELAMTMGTVFTIFGLLGACFHLGGYFLIAYGKVTSEDISFYVINLFAGIFVFVSLASAFNLPTAITQSFWIFISGRTIIKKKQAQYYQKLDAIDGQRFEQLNARDIPKTNAAQRYPISRIN
ncbi:MAG: hypothetical protein AAF429_09150 [Pseudomonadota bacterium]